MSTPRFGGKTLANSDGTSEVQSGFSGAAAGTRVQTIRVCTGPTTAPGTGVLTVLVHDGTNSFAIAQVTLVNTVNTEVTTLYFPNLTLPSTSHNIRLQMRTAITAGGTAHVSIEGFDY